MVCNACVALVSRAHTFIWRGPNNVPFNYQISLIPEATELQVEPKKETSELVPPLAMTTNSLVERDQAPAISR